LKAISICIPAYKRPENVQRLLRSIAIQTYGDYEIIVTDDSPDDSVKGIIDSFPELPLQYIKNPKSLGTPANWNYAISLARGEWIKIMHDDDWFDDKNALQIFADCLGRGSRFIVCRYYDVFSSGRKRESAFPLGWRSKIIASPLMLLSRNVIGPPSTVLIHNSIRELYDIRMKWRVDIDYYVRVLSLEKSFELIDRPLICVGISETQVTNDCINMPEIELPEGLLLLQKYGTDPLKNILVYDAWWRILRNLNIRDVKQLQAYTGLEKWPEIIIKMIQFQSGFSSALLNFGPVSKTLMCLSYLINKSYFKR
jgi:glycosyltransferase involved in cell wall biosynthesis